MFVYTFYPKGNAPNFFCSPKPRNIVLLVVNNIESNLIYEKRRTNGGTPEMKLIQEIESFMQKVVDDPSIENGQKLISLYEAERLSREDRAILHELRDVPVSQDYN